MTDKKNSLKDNVLERLEREGITPHSRYYWLSYEYAFWAAWGLSVVLGSVALAVLSFTSVYIGYSLFEATHSGFLTFFFDALPYLWLLAFALLTVVAHFNLRNTKRGYKYPLYLVIGSSFGFSILGSIFLHYMGAGYYLDRYLGEHVWGYQSRVEFETHVWQNPKAGRLLGRIESPTEAAFTKVSFVDVNNQKWNIIVTDLRSRDAELLLSGDRVRVLTATTSEEVEADLMACAVFPWLLNEAPIVAKWKEDRMLFQERLAERREKIKALLENREVEKPEIQATSSPETVVAEAASSPCSNHPVFKGKS